MSTILQRLEQIDWQSTSEDLHGNGHVVVPQVLTKEECSDLVLGYDKDNLYRKTISMQRYRFGSGEYKYFQYPLPALITTIRETVYPRLAPIANRWMEAAGVETRFPAAHEELRRRCNKKGQTKPTVLILKYGHGGFNTLHQDLYGEVYFPMQLVLFLNQPEKDYTGGEFVLTEQIPRAQSKAIVLQPGQGDMLLFTTSWRPVKGSRGWYRVNMKHGVSPVNSGSRHTLGIIFHDAES
ncbi:MAG: 2OG-Fe(II) oxygenase [Bacteroidetes bacterium]|nr:2OG-Fe(II) oxygenase [Bacteroidota bacterium]